METIAKCHVNPRSSLPCCVSFEQFSTYHVFQYANLPDVVVNTIQFVPFNHNEMWAREVLVDGDDYFHMDYKPITSTESESYVHLIIIGLTQLGEALAMEVARTAHFPNCKKHKTKITIIDKHMEHEMESFIHKCGEFFSLAKWHYIDTHDRANDRVSDISNKYQHLITNKQDRCFIDSEWTFINGSDASAFVANYIAESVTDANAVPTIAICINEMEASLHSAMTLPNEVYESKIPVLVHQSMTDAAVDALRGKNTDKKYDRYEMLRAFGMEEMDFEPKLMRLIDCGKRINYLYNHVDAKDIDEAEADKLWEEVPIHKRWSNIYSAVTIPIKYRCVENLSWPLTNSGQLAFLSEMEHNRWMVEELLLGYRPVLEQEDKQIDADKSLKRVYKDKFIHYDIRPNDGLKTDQSGRNVAEYDEIIVRNLHLIYR
ncbi:MAG: hypothetical protein Q4D14_07610 [Bacteroidales bacterium]|nr:hypothetical protein [Bacteroidales bacterium]